MLSKLNELLNSLNLTFSGNTTNIDMNKCTQLVNSISNKCKTNKFILPEVRLFLSDTVVANVLDTLDIVLKKPLEHINIKTIVAIQHVHVTIPINMEIIFSLKLYKDSVNQQMLKDWNNSFNSEKSNYKTVLVFIDKHNLYGIFDSDIAMFKQLEIIMLSKCFNIQFGMEYLLELIVHDNPAKTLITYAITTQFNISFNRYEHLHYDTQFVYFMHKTNTLSILNDINTLGVTQETLLRKILLGNDYNKLRNNEQLLISKLLNHFPDNIRRLLNEPLGLIEYINDLLDDENLYMNTVNAVFIFVVAKFHNLSETDFISLLKVINNNLLETDPNAIIFTNAILSADSKFIQKIIYIYNTTGKKIPINYWLTQTLDEIDKTVYTMYYTMVILNDIYVNKMEYTQSDLY